MYNAHAHTMTARQIDRLEGRQTVTETGWKAGRVGIHTLTL